MRHGKGVDNGLLKLRNDGGEPTDVVECHRNVLGSNDVHGDGLLIFGKNEILFVRAMSGWGGGGGVVIIGGRGTVKAAKDSGGGGALAFGFFVVKGLVCLDAGESIADEVVDGDVLQGHEDWLVQSRWVRRWGVEDPYRGSYEYQVLEQSKLPTA